MAKRSTTTFRRRASHSEVETDDEFGLTIQREGSERACLDCIGKPGENQT